MKPLPPQPSTGAARQSLAAAGYAAGATTIIGLGLLALLVGCTVGPDYHRPPLSGANPLPEKFAGVATNPSPVEWHPAEPTAHRARGAWWLAFGDLELNRLEALVVTNNQQLVAALARFEQARAQVNIARADFFPQAEVMPSYSRQRTSFNQPQSGHAAVISPTFNTFTLSLQAGWEADLWGRVRRQVESARARLAAGAEDLEGAKLAIAAELATDYFALRAFEGEMELLERTIVVYRRSLELTINRRQGGIVTDLDVAQAQTQLRVAEAQLPALRLQHTRLLHALATLTGQPATGFEVVTNRVEFSPGLQVPPVLPSELLERRPDVAGAEQRVASANAQVGVATSAFYPRLRLNGATGLQSIDAATWFDWPSRFWAVGPSLQVPLFTGGRNRAQLASARAIYDETVANYRQTVLTAFQEVEDQLAAQGLLREQLIANRSALAAAQRTVEIANNRYHAGLVTYLEVATAQGVALNLERTVVQLQGQIQVAAVGLIRALGGGWE